MRSVLSEEMMPMNEILSQCSDFEESQVLDAIRFLVDNEVLQVEKDGFVSRKDNKKSRQ